MGEANAPAKKPMAQLSAKFVNITSDRVFLAFDKKVKQPVYVYAQHGQKPNLLTVYCFSQRVLNVIILVDDLIVRFIICAIRVLGKKSYYG